jgi:putative RecB family exonuclease
VSDEADKRPETREEWLAHVKEQPRSFSQLSQYEQCPKALELARVDRAWQRPAAWFPQGTAFHEAAELYEKAAGAMTREGMREAFKDAYARDVDAYTDGTPNFGWWFSSGPYGGRDDVERRWLKGLEQVDRYLDYREGKGQEDVLWVAPDGTPGIELGFDFDLDGVRVRGKIDQVVMVKPKIPKPKSRAKAAMTAWAEAVEAAVPKPRVRDLKTGKKPGDTFQLKVYGMAVEHDHGLVIEEGDYWMAETGGPTTPFGLTDTTREDISERFRAMDEGVKAERFEPLPEHDKCSRCSVAFACPFEV